MIAKIAKYEIDARDRAVTVTLGFYNDAGTRIDTDTVVVSTEKFTADFVIDRIRGILDVKIHQDDPLPTEAQLEAILPIGFKVTVPG
jgi:hypothetical protein